VAMVNNTLSTSSLGASLTDLLLAEDIEPGTDVGYQTAKTIYLQHPLGEKMVDAPVRAAQSQKRDVSVPESPGDHVRDAFLAEWRKMRIDEVIANTAGVARIYGVGSVVMGCRGKPSNLPIPLDALWKADIFFNVVDPLNTAGSIGLNQDPNSPDFQQVAAVSVSGQVYHPSRACVIMNGRPVYIAYTNSAFGYVGRSVYQRALYPLKTFVQSMITDDMVTTKVGLLVAKIKGAGAVVDRMMQTFTAIKREMLQGASTGNVLSIGKDDEVSTLDMQNVDGAGGWARGNALKNIATAADMPAVMLENETLTEGFGEGSEDAKVIARYIDGIREWLDTLYDFFDPIIQRRAWNPEFYKTIQAQFPADYGSVDFNTAYYQWANSFCAVWPNLLKEPDSEGVKVEKIKAEALISVAETMMAIGLDPENKATLAQWIADNINENKLMFTAPLILDYEALANYVPPNPLAIGAEGSEGGEDEGTAQKALGKPPLRIAG
jgi:hypothetical protein